MASRLPRARSLPAQHHLAQTAGCVAEPVTYGSAEALPGHQVQDGAHRRLYFRALRQFVAYQRAPRQRPYVAPLLTQQELEEKRVVIEQISLNVAGGERLGMRDGRVPRLVLRISISTRSRSCSTRVMSRSSDATVSGVCVRLCDCSLEAASAFNCSRVRAHAAPASGPLLRGRPCRPR